MVTDNEIMSGRVCFISLRQFDINNFGHFRGSRKNCRKMNNLHETFGEAHLDFEIDFFQAKMIQAIVSFKLGPNIEYEELTVLQLIDQKYTVMVNTSGKRVEFCIR